VTDINVTNIDITHDYISDLTLTLRSPVNTNAILIDQPCSDEKALKMGFDDQTTNAKGTFPCPPNDGKLYQPENFLSTFNGINATGLWTLRVKDNGDQDGGTLNAWRMRICVNNIVIPVELVDFKAKSLTNTIQLVWQTATERNNAGFEIQRSTDPYSAESRSSSGSNFTTIGFVKGQGNATKLVDYQFIDADVRLGTTYYYRLRQIDFEGKEMFSKVEAANLDKDGVWDIALEPNPTESTLNVEVLGKANQSVILDLYSIDGRLILTKKMTTQNTKAALDLGPLSNGIYMLKCHAGTQFFVKKVVKKS
jgi:subtilisin-like proprotein convertase family protein